MFFSLIYSLISILLILRAKKPILILVIVALLPVYSIFRPGTYESGDLSLHVVKLVDFYTNLSEGNILPRWAGQENANYGYPLFLFTYLTPYYFGSVFHFVGFDFLTSMKLVLALSYVLSGIFMYLWAKRQFRSELAGLAAGIFYLFTPYHLVDLHFRAAAGEMMAFMFAPLVLMGICKRSRVMASFCFALLILSHQVISLTMLPVFLWYSYKVDPKQIKNLVLGIVLSSFYWLPILFESRYIYQSILPNPTSWPNWNDFYYSPWRWGLLFQGPEGQIRAFLGYTQWVLVLLALNRRANWLLVLFFGYFFLMNPISAPLWKTLPLLSNFQFAYRILAVETLILSMLAAIIVPTLPRRLGIIFLACTILITILNWGNRRNIPEIGEEQLLQRLPYITAQMEGHVAAVIGPDPTRPWMDKVPFNFLEVVLGNAEITPLIRKTTYHSYKVVVSDNAHLVEHTTKFPGWELWIDRKKVMDLQITKGEHVVEVIFSDTEPRRRAKILSLCGLVVLIIKLGRDLYLIGKVGINNKFVKYSRWLGASR